MAKLRKVSADVCALRVLLTDNEKQCGNSEHLDNKTLDTELG